MGCPEALSAGDYPPPCYGDVLYVLTQSLFSVTDAVREQAPYDRPGCEGIEILREVNWNEHVV